VHRGYVKLFRKIQDNFLWKERREFSKAEAWIDILMEAQYKKDPQIVVFGMKTLEQNYGECLKSNVTWSRRWHWSEPKVRRFIKMLQEMNQIRSKSEGFTTRLSIVNYRIYDECRRTSDEQVTSTRRAGDEQVTTNNKDKKVKKVNKPPYSPPKGIDLKNNGNGWIDCESWDEFVEHRKAIRKPLSERAAKISLAFLKKNIRDQKQIIETTIMNRWTGLFPLKGASQDKPHRSESQNKKLKELDRIMNL
jgi:hypothetical protein